MVVRKTKKKRARNVSHMQDRRIFWSWLLDGRVSQRSELGVMTAPRVLSLDPGAETKTLRPFLELTVF